MTRPSVRVTCTSTDLIEPEKLIPLQGELKWLEDKQYEKLKASLLRHGFSFPVFGWKHQKKHFVIDAHQRLRAIGKMREDGIELVGGKVPVIWVKAKDRDEALELILVALSQYGRTDEDHIYAFVKENEMDWPELRTEIDFPSINMGKLQKGWFDSEFNPDEPKQNAEVKELWCRCEDCGHVHELKKDERK